MTAAETYGNANFNSNITTNNHNSLPATIQGNSSSPSDTPIELTENFYINNSNKKRHNLKIQVQLNGSGIFLRRETEDHDQITEQLIRLEDIVGSHCGGKLKRRARGGLSSCKRLSEDEEQHHSENSTAREQKDISAYLYIYAYLRKDKPLRRMRTVRILRFRSFLKYEENLKSAERWRDAIKFNKSLEEHGAVMEPKPLLILLNPKSGKGKGRVMFQKQMAPVLKEAETQYELVVTTHANFAREFVKQRKDLAQKYSGIVVASGDGLLFEVINGIMERTDWRVLTRQLPLGIIPCGSGNGLAKSIAYLYNEPYEPKPIVNATLTCVSGKWAPLDVVRVELKKQDNLSEMYSFLSIGWGIIADIDIESEKLRSIGAPRFTLWSIHRLVRLRTYKGKVSYLPWRKPENTLVVEMSNEKQTNGGKPSILRRFKDAQDDEAEEFVDAVGDDIDLEDDEFADIISYRTNIDSWHSAVSRRTAYYSIAGQSIRSNRSVTNSIFSKIEQANAEFNTRALQSSIPPLDSPLPEEWHSEQGEFVLVQAAYTTHLATDCLFAPDSKLNDGIIYLVIIRAGIARSQLMQFLLNMSSGSHLSEAPTTHIQVIPVTAFRIEPEDDEGIITVDGERVGYGVIQAEIFPGLMKVMVPNVPKE
ncbi:sphingosine kinase 1-like [Lucilia sericata]|uniref:sphingosine kinase 1-like n=1 Tax=Lucilia sericata TaxID=13632 RepID=UPI0018A7EEDF|nr:sphingosine kinase 1-like [Lucilia sericata]XP_037818717.1 sphingosine kinase 1-like [Lucilia sericata]XP_037826539.1 sphingosine kinase 1-like [Lucilia sericata]